MKRPLLFAALLLVIFVGYLELRQPETATAQGRDAVYQQLAVTNDVRIAGALTFGTNLTPAMTAKLAATGTALSTTYLRGDGVWAGVSPPTYWSFTSATLTISTDTWTDTGLGLSVVTTATDTVILDVNLGAIQQCALRVFGGSTALQGHAVEIRYNQQAHFTFAETPGAGTHNYKVQVKRNDGSRDTCYLNGGAYAGQPVYFGATFLAQVLQ